MEKKTIFIIILIFSCLLITSGLYTSQYSNIPVKSYTFSINRGDPDPFEYIRDFQINIDFSTNKGNMTFRIIDKNIDKISIGLPNECKTEYAKFDNQSKSYFIEPNPVQITPEKQAQRVNLNLSCQDLESNARFSLFLTGNETKGVVQTEEHNENPVFVKLKLDKWIKCNDKCIELEYSNQNVRVAQFGNLLKVYTIRGINKGGKVIQFHTNTYDFFWFFISGLLRDLGICILAAGIFYLFTEIFRKKYSP